MKLNTDTRHRLATALTSVEAAAEVADAVEKGAKEAANIAAIGPTTNLRSDNLANLAADAEARLDTIEAKLDSLLLALKGAGKMVADE